MPKGRPTRPIRVDLDEWAAFGEACEAQGTDRSAVLRAYMRRYVAAWKGRGGHGRSSGDKPSASSN